MATIATAISEGRVAMTENEAIARIIDHFDIHHHDNRPHPLLDEAVGMAIKALENKKTMECLLEKAAEEIENLYGRETELSEEIRNLLDCLN